MMYNLKTGGILKQISGVIVGYFTAISDRETAYGMSSAEIIREAVASYRYPVCFGFPAGHELPNRPLIMGSRIVLNVSDNYVNIETL